MEVLVLSASRGLAPREGLELLMQKVGHTMPSLKPRRGPQAGKSGTPVLRTPTKWRAAWAPLVTTWEFSLFS